MDPDFDKLEHRLDRVEAWHDVEEAVKKEKAEAETQRHTRLQLGMSIISTVTMLINFYLTIHHGK